MLSTNRRHRRYALNRLKGTLVPMDIELSKKPKHDQIKKALELEKPNKVKQ